MDRVKISQGEIPQPSPVNCADEIYPAESLYAQGPQLVLNISPKNLPGSIVTGIMR
jgi:hypothetical protein